jgi:hypothetical protein
MDVLEFWMCLNCSTFHLLSDFRMLEKRQKQETESSEQEAGTTGAESPSPSGPDPSPAARGREYLGLKCPVCGIEQFKIGGKITCARGHDAMENPDAC